MGSCCFTPRKTHFLWWYWLALASVVGIPMFAAAYYVARRRAAGETDMAAVGRRASRIFWFGTALLVLVIAPVGCQIANGTGSYINPMYEWNYGGTFYVLAIDFFVCLALAGMTLKIVSGIGSLFNRVVIISLMLALWVFFSPLAIIANPLEILSAGVGEPDRLYPVMAILMFAVCLTMAHHWRRFLDEPTQRRAIWALVGAVIGALLFYCAARYGNTLHYYLHEIVRGHSPTPQEAHPFLMQ